MELDYNCMQFTDSFWYWHYYNSPFTIWIYLLISVGLSLNAMPILLDFLLGISSFASLFFSDAVGGIQGFCKVDVMDTIIKPTPMGCCVN
jgi:hypothetical protein